MSTTTLTKAVRTLIAAGTSNAAGATTRGVVDLRTAQGGILTIKTTNAGTLGVQAEVRILIAHNSGATPAAGSAGADWKTVYVWGTGVVSGVTNEFPPFRVGPEVMHLEVEVTGNTTNAVTCEAFLSEISNAVSA